MINVLFLCHGNICRSPMAEFIMKDKLKHLHLVNEFNILSRSLSYEEQGNDIYYEAKKILEFHNIKFTHHASERVIEKELDEADYIFIMDQNNYRLLQYLFPKHADRVNYLLKNGISDPWYTRDFERAYNDIEEGINYFLQQLGLMK